MYNYVMLMGTVVEVRDEFIVNQKATHIKLACRRPFRERDGRFVVDEFDITVYDYLAETVKEHLKEGSRISVKGRLNPSNYQSLCKIVGEHIFFMEEGVAGAINTDGKKDC
ncbi:MAG: single-stranded DNA-binding protein [Methanobrevibacter sp.]|nr:single-stranded DNA-binding protein [Methanobrevibacter sp.]